MDTSDIFRTVKHSSLPLERESKLYFVYTGLSSSSEAEDKDGSTGGGPPPVLFSSKFLSLVFFMLLKPTFILFLSLVPCVFLVFSDVLPFPLGFDWDQAFIGVLLNLCQL